MLLFVSSTWWASNVSSVTWEMNTRSAPALTALRMCRWNMRQCGPWRWLTGDRRMAWFCDAYIYEPKKPFMANLIKRFSCRLQQIKSNTKSVILKFLQLFAFEQNDVQVTITCIGAPCVVGDGPLILPGGGGASDSAPVPVGRFPLFRLPRLPTPPRKLQVLR